MANGSSSSPENATEPSVPRHGPAATAVAETVVVFATSVELRMSLASALWCSVQSIALLGMSIVVFCSRFLALLASSPFAMVGATWAMIGLLLFTTYARTPRLSPWPCRPWELDRCGPLRLPRV